MGKAGWACENGLRLFSDPLTGPYGAYRASVADRPASRPVANNTFL